MCLDVVMTKTEFEAKYGTLKVEGGVRIAWKVFRTTPDRRLEAVHRNMPQPFRVGEWIINKVKVSLGYVTHVSSRTNNSMYLDSTPTSRKVTQRMWVGAVG